MNELNGSRCATNSSVSKEPSGHTEHLCCLVCEVESTLLSHCHCWHFFSLGIVYLLTARKVHRSAAGSWIRQRCTPVVLILASPDKERPGSRNGCGWKLHLWSLFFLAEGSKGFGPRFVRHLQRGELLSTVLRCKSLVCSEHGVHSAHCEVVVRI